MKLSLAMFPVLGLLLGMADVYYYEWQFWAILVWTTGIWVSARLID